MHTKNEAPDDPEALREGPYNGKWNARSIYAMVVLTTIYTLIYVDRQVLSLVLPQLKKDLVLSDTALGAVTGLAFVLVYSTATIPIARFADRSNRRNILAAGVAFWSAMTALSGLAANVWHLAAARFLMGAGEATGIAPSTSITSDIFTNKRRPLAMGILTSGISLSALLFFPILGWISYTYGWRATFVAAGIPGILVGLLLYLTVPEPKRVARKVRAQESFLATMRFMAGARSYVFTVSGATILGITLYAMSLWNPTFLVRVHGLNQAELGAAVGLTRGVLGLAGALSAGYITSLLVGRDERWMLLLPGFACVLIFPFEMLALFHPDIRLVLFGLGASSFVNAMHYGPIYAACQNVARPSMRATSVAIYLLFANIVGQIVGPIVVGFLNDQWEPIYGQEAVRYSLALVTVGALVGGLLIMWGARYLKSERHRSET